MRETTNYNLKKIELTDSPPDITVLNNNWDTIDEELKSQADALDAHSAEETQQAHLAKNIGIESENFESQNVEGALDELFTSVSSGKELIATAITDKGGNASGSDSFGDLADEIYNFPEYELVTEEPYEIFKKIITGVANSTSNLGIMRMSDDDIVFFTNNTYMVYRTDLNGNIIQSIKYSETNAPITPRCIDITSNRDILFINNTSAIHVQKLDMLGNIINLTPTPLNNGFNSRILRVDKNDDSMYVINSHSANQCYLRKILSNGTQVWIKTLSSIIPNYNSSNTGLVIDSEGNVYNISAGENNSPLIAFRKYDSNGDELVTSNITSFKGYERGTIHDVVIDEYNSLIYCTSTFTISSSGTNEFLCFSLDGDLLWSDSGTIYSSPSVDEYLKDGVYGVGSTTSISKLSKDGSVLLKNKQLYTEVVNNIICHDGQIYGLSSSATLYNHILEPLYKKL